jgi:L-aspartate oxidase
MDSLPTETDFIVVGAGVAGLRAAIELASAGRVLVLAKQEFTESATQYAQGGIAVVLGDEDEIGLHLQDTIDAGDGIVNVEAAKVLVEEGPPRIQELLEWGTEFDRTGSKLTFTREAAHSRSRILHAHGDSTGREIGRALAAKARTLSNISFSEFEFTADLLVAEGLVHGVRLVGKGDVHDLQASAVLLATGGVGQVYRDTTNPAVATADGIAMAYRAGAVLSDMEFVQFHPTALFVANAPRFLLSEALRGEGAYLLNREQERFMPSYNVKTELAPRDVVARAIASEIARDSAADACVYLDMRHLDAKHLAVRFPRIYATCLLYHIDITKDLVPVRPAAHYLMGGVRTDLDGRTSLPGLFAAGETACTGVHGANRLASNSLLEGLVYGARAGARMRDEFSTHRQKSVDSRIEQEMKADDIGDGMADSGIRNIQELMSQSAGVVRNGKELGAALQTIQTLSAKLPQPRSRRCCEARNIQQAANLILKSAVARHESRGAHYRTDFPQHDDVGFRKHSLVQRNKDGSYKVWFEPR